MKLKIDFKKYTFVDLGLPSGTLWASESVIGHFTAYEAQSIAPSNIPTPKEAQELSDVCSWSWDDMRNGFLITGTNGKTIFLQCNGYIVNDYIHGNGKWANYWTSDMDHDSYAYKFRFTRSRSSFATELVRKSVKMSMHLVKHGNGKKEETTQKSATDITAEQPIEIPESPINKKINIANRTVKYLLKQKGETAATMCQKAGVNLAEFDGWTKGEEMTDKSVNVLSAYLGVPKALFTMRQTATEPTKKAEVKKQTKEEFVLPTSNIININSQVADKVFSYKKEHPDVTKTDFCKTYPEFKYDIVSIYWYYKPNVQDVAWTKDLPVVIEIVKWLKKNLTIKVKDSESLTKIISVKTGISDATVRKYICIADILVKLEQENRTLPIPSLAERIKDCKSKGKDNVKKYAAKNNININYGTYLWLKDAEWEEFQELPKDEFEKINEIALWLKQLKDDDYIFLEHKKLLKKDKKNSIRLSDVNKYYHAAKRLIQLNMVKSQKETIVPEESNMENNKPYEASEEEHRLVEKAQSTHPLERGQKKDIRMQISFEAEQDLFTAVEELYFRLGKTKRELYNEALELLLSKYNPNSPTNQKNESNQPEETVEGKTPALQGSDDTSKERTDEFKKMFFETIKNAENVSHECMRRILDIAQGVQDNIINSVRCIVHDEYKENQAPIQQDAKQPVKEVTDDNISINRYLILGGIDSKSIHVILASKALGEIENKEEKISQITGIRRRKIKELIKKHEGVL